MTIEGRLRARRFGPLIGPVLALACVALLAKPAHAQRTSSLSWVRLAGAEECIATQALAERVEERVGHRVFVSASQADLSLEGHIERVADGFVATLVVSDRAGRELGRRVLRARGPDCAALDPSLVLVIAIGLDPDAALASTHAANDALSPDTKALLEQLELPKASEQDLRDLAVPDPAAEAELERRAGATRVSRDPVAPARVEPIGTDTETAAVEGVVTLGITGELGVMPDPALGGTLRAAFRIVGFWPVEVSATGLFAERASGTSTTGTGEVGFLAGGIALCTPANSRNLFAVLGCGGTRIGVLTVTATGFAEDRSTRSTWVDLAGQAAARLRLGASRRWVLQLTAAAAVPVIRDTYRYEDRSRDLRVLHRPSWLIGRIELGTGFGF